MSGYERYGRNENEIVDGGLDDIEVEIDPSIDSRVGPKGPKHEKTAVEEQDKEEQDKDEQDKKEQDKDEQGKEEQDKEEQAKDEQDKDEQGKDEQAKDEQGKDEQDKDEQGKDEQAKDEQDKDEQAKDEQAKDEQDKDEVGQLHAAIILEPQQDGTMEMTPVGATMNKAPENINKEFAVIRDNIIDKETLAAQLHKVTELGIEDVMQSVEQLKGVLDKLGIPYDKSKNLVVEDRNGGKTAFCLTDDKEAEQEQTADMEQDMESQAIPETQEDKKIEGRIRDVSGIGSGELHAIVNSKDKKEFNNVIDNINDSKERATMAMEQAHQVDKRQEKEAKEQGGYEMTR